MWVASSSVLRSVALVVVAGALAWPCDAQRSTGGSSGGFSGGSSGGFHGGGYSSGGGGGGGGGGDVSTALYIVLGVLGGVGLLVVFFAFYEKLIKSRVQEPTRVFNVDAAGPVRTTMTLDGSFDGWYEQRTKYDIGTGGYRYRQWGHIKVREGVLSGTGSDEGYTGTISNFTLTGHVRTNEVHLRKSYGPSEPPVLIVIPYDFNLGSTRVGHYEFIDNDRLRTRTKGRALLRFRAPGLTETPTYWGDITYPARGVLPLRFAAPAAPVAHPGPVSVSMGAGVASHPLGGYTDDSGSVKTPLLAPELASVEVRRSAKFDMRNEDGTCPLCCERKVSSSSPVICRSGHTGVCPVCTERLLAHVTTTCPFCREKLLCTF